MLWRTCLAGIQELDVCGLPVEDADLACALDALRDLRTLNLNGCKKLSPAVMQLLVAHMLPPGATLPGVCAVRLYAWRGARVWPGQCGSGGGGWAGGGACDGMQQRVRLTPAASSCSPRLSCEVSHARAAPPTPSAPAQHRGGAPAAPRRPARACRCWA